MVEEIRLFTPQDLADLDALMHELSTTSFCNEALLNNALNDANVHVYVIMNEGHIVATGTRFASNTRWSLPLLILNLWLSALSVVAVDTERS